MSIEEERDAWLNDQTQASIMHRMEDGRHRITMSTQEYGDAIQREAVGVGKTYLEALLVALRNWEAEWANLEGR
jgi:hypothetical protein